jgi:hypothetical protein
LYASLNYSSTSLKRAAYAQKPPKNYSKRWNGMLYEPNEIRASEKQLEKIFKQLKEPCLLGGWATYQADLLIKTDC